jgi:hypothetical protein
MKPYCIHSETRGALFDLVFKLLDTPDKRNMISGFMTTLLDKGLHMLIPINLRFGGRYISG